MALYKFHIIIIIIIIIIMNMHIVYETTFIRCWSLKIITFR